MIIMTGCNTGEGGCATNFGGVTLFYNVVAIVGILRLGIDKFCQQNFEQNGYQKEMSISLSKTDKES